MSYHIIGCGSSIGCDGDEGELISVWSVTCIFAPVRRPFFLLFLFPTRAVASATAFSINKREKSFGMPTSSTVVDRVGGGAGPGEHTTVVFG